MKYRLKILLFHYAYMKIFAIELNKKIRIITECEQASKQFERVELSKLKRKEKEIG
jgi:hypothetical protein